MKQPQAEQPFPAESEHAEENRLLDVLAHDLRAGLVPVKTYTQMLATGILGDVSPKQADALRAVDASIDKLTDKIAAVLDMVKAGENRLEIQRDPVVLPEVLRRALANSEREYKRRNLRPLVQLDAPVGLVEGDQPRLQRCFVSLLSRCVRRTPAGGEFGVELSATEGEAQVRFFDRGAALDEREIEALTRSLRGTPRAQDKPFLEVELAALFDIVQAHGGRVQVQNETNGATYLIHLPVLKRKPSGTSGRTP